LVKWGWSIRVLAIWGFGKMGLVNQGTGNLGFGKMGLVNQGIDNLGLGRLGLIQGIAGNPGLLNWVIQCAVV